MKTVKNNLPAIISIMMFAVFSATMFMTTYLSGAELNKSLTLICVGAVITAITAFAKEKHVYKASPILYVVTLLLLLFQFICEDYSGFNRYIYVFGYFTIQTASLLPLVNLQLANKINKYKTPDIWQFCKICAVVLLPVLLVWLQPEVMPSAMAVTVLFIVALVMSIKKRVKIHPALFVIPVIAAIAVYAYACFEDTYIYERLMVILTRGQCDPFGMGWRRTIIDSVIKTAPFIGNAKIMGAAWSERSVYMNNWYDHKILLILGEYGWLGLIIAVAAYAVFFACVFKMVKETKQSTFARYASFALALSLFMQAFVSLLSLFVLECGYIDMPFIATGYTHHFVSCLIFGVILALYFRRNTKSEIKEENIKNDFSVIKSIFSSDDEYDFDDEDLPDINFNFALLFGTQLGRTYEEIEESDLEKYSPLIEKTYNRLARLCERYESYYDEADLYYMKSLVITERFFKQKPDEYRKKLAFSYNEYANFLVKAEDYERAEKFFLESIKLHEETPVFSNSVEKLRFANGYHDLGYCYEKQENYGNALKYYLIEAEKMLQFAEEEPDEFMYELADAYVMLGYFHRKLDKYNKAQEYYRMAIDVYLKMINEMHEDAECELSDCYRTAAKYAMEQFDFKRAYQLYSLARKIPKA